MNIVDIHEVKLHLHYNDNSNDLPLNSFIVAAESIIKNYIRDNIELEDPAIIKQAVLLLIEYWEQCRKTGAYSSINGNYLPASILSLLSTYHKQ